MVFKSSTSEIENNFLKLCSEVAEDIELNIYDLNYIKGSQTLNVFVEDPNTGTALIEDCAKMDRALTPFIDELKWMPAELILVVSSPGMFRELNRIEHFVAVVDKQIQIQLTKKFSEISNVQASKKMMGSKKLIGTLIKCTEESIELEIDDKSNSRKIEFNFNDIKKANLEPSINSSH